MKNPSNSLLFMALVSAIILLITPVPAAGTPEYREWSEFIDRQMVELMGRYDLPNAAVALVAGGKIEFMKGYGFSDPETLKEVDPRSALFRVGSVSKIFTWTAVMQLVERGEMDLDKDINHYLDFSQQFCPASACRSCRQNGEGLPDGWRRIQERRI